MKQYFLFLILLLAICPLSAQEVIWQEDFSEGLHGWTVNTTSCSGITHPNFGVWELTEGTVDGQPFAFENGFFRWSFINSVEYSISFADEMNPAVATTYGTVYARYQMNNGVLQSDISTDILNASMSGDTAFIQTNGIVRWAANMELADQNLAFMSRLIGIDNPTINFSNGSQNFTYQSQDGAVSLIFSKTKNCGDLWNWSPNGNVGYGIFGVQAGFLIESETRENGAVVINTLFHNAGGDPSYNPNTDPFYPFVSELISPSIDISTTNKPLALELTEFVLYAHLSPEGPMGMSTSFAVSNDDGLTWSDDYNINEGLLPFSDLDDTPLLPIKISDIGDADEIRIKFTWSADLFFWALDDIAVVEREPYEIKINKDFFAIPTNVWTPASQVEPQFFIADIQNNGGATAENVVLNLSIDNISDNDPVVYNENNIFGNIVSDSLAENRIFDEPLFAEDQLSGLYRGKYTLSHDAIDSNEDNNEIEFIFSITDTIFSKETGRTTQVAPFSTSWYIGNSFYMPNGEGWYARYLTFMVDNASQAVNGAGKVVTHLYESDGDVNNNGRISGSELTEIATNEYFFDGSENQELITIPINGNTEEGVSLANGKHYLAVVQYKGLNNNDQLLLSASDEYDYGANFFVNSTLMMPRYSDIVVETSSSNPSFFIGGFQGAVVPVIRLSIGDNPNLNEEALAINHILADEYQMRVFPNPVKENFELELDFPTQMNVNISLFDENGRIVLSENYSQLNKGRFNYDARQLSAGVYFLKLTTPYGVKTGKVVVVK